jgi:hypothetical protein
LIQGIVQGRRGVHSISLASRGLVFGPSPEFEPVLDLVRHRRWLQGATSMMKRSRGLLVRCDAAKTPSRSRGLSSTRQTRRRSWGLFRNP